MDLRYASAFYEAASALHFGKAAQKLSIAPSALTRQIQLFEESVGESLFVRSNRRVILSQKGQEILTLLKPIVGWNQERKLHVRIGGLIGVIDNHFWPRMHDYVQSRNVRLSVSEHSSAPAIEKLLMGELDLVFVNEKLSDDLIQYFPLGREELVLISKKKVALKDIPKQTWIYSGRGSKLRSLSDRESPQQIHVSSIAKVLDLVEMGLGIGITPASEKLASRNFLQTPIPIKNRNTYLASLKYQVVPPHLKEIVQRVLGKK